MGRFFSVNNLSSKRFTEEITSYWHKFERKNEKEKIAHFIFKFSFIEASPLLFPTLTVVIFQDVPGFEQKIFG